MSSNQFDDLTLMAYVDGELEPSQRLAVEAALASDVQLSRRVEQFRQSKSMTREAYASQLDEPIPAHLLAAVRSAAARRVQPERPRPAASGAFRRWLTAIWQPLPAFAIGAMVFVVAGYEWGARQTDGLTDVAGGVQLSGVENKALQQALTTLPGGQQAPLSADGSSRVTLIGTFRAGDGELCREFDVRRDAEAGLIGVACHGDGRWTLAFATLTASGSDGYAPASSAGVVDAYLVTRKASAMLSPEEERQALLATSP